MANGLREKPDESKKCRILEIGLGIADDDNTPAHRFLVQYSCDTETNQRGEIVPHCFPIPRLFKLSA